MEFESQRLEFIVMDFEFIINCFTFSGLRIDAISWNQGGNERKTHWHIYFW